MSDFGIKKQRLVQSREGKNQTLRFFSHSYQLVIGALERLMVSSFVVPSAYIVCRTIIASLSLVGMKIRFIEVMLKSCLTSMEIILEIRKQIITDNLHG